jgi:bifunctional non-homologous end joining protein LigD
MPTIKETTLHYIGGTSDKIYKAWVENYPTENQFIVNFAFGRRGSRLQTGTKTNSSVSLTNATKIYDKLIDSKLAKGYNIIGRQEHNGGCLQTQEVCGSIQESVDSYRIPNNPTNSPNKDYLPILLNTTTEEEIEALSSNKNWVFQEKFDGKRLIVSVKDQKSKAFNKKGIEIGIPHSILEEAEILAQGENIVLDGEYVNNTFIVFDIIAYKKCLKKAPYSTRLEILEKIFSRFSGLAIRGIETSKSTKEKRELFLSLKSSKKEGVVAKELSATYLPGRPNSKGPYLKHKFVKTTSAIVSGHNQKHSVCLCLLENGKKIPIGNVTIPQREPLPEVDSVIEVKYLYAMPNSNSLYQPTFLTKRDDVDQKECTLSQLEYKSN